MVSNHGDCDFNLNPTLLHIIYYYFSLFRQNVLLQNDDSNNSYKRQDKLVIFSTQYCSLVTGSCITNKQGCINNGPFKERSPRKQDIHGDNNNGSSVPTTNAVTQHKLTNV